MLSQRICALTFTDLINQHGFAQGIDCTVIPDYGKNQNFFKGIIMSNELMGIVTNKDMVMTSKQITDYLNQFNDEAGIEARFRHDNVKRTIGTLCKQGVIQYPQSEDAGRINGLGLVQKEVVYIFEGEQGKRDCITLVAQLSPLHTSCIVDRWIELESKASQPVLPSNYIEALEGLLASKRNEQVLEQQVNQKNAQLAIAAPKVAFADRVSNSEGSMSRRNAAKCLDYPPLAFNQWLRDNRFNNQDGMPAQTEITRGRQRVIVGEHNGRARRASHITAKGLLYYATKLYGSEVPDDVLDNIDEFKAGIEG